MPKRLPGRPRKFSEETQVFSLRIPVSLHEAIRTYVDERGLSTNTMLLKAVEAWWSALPEHEKYDRDAKRANSGVKRRNHD
jgi:hypothetical protein